MKNYFIAVLSVFSVLSFSQVALASSGDSPHTFSQAKKELFSIYKNSPSYMVTIYAGCSFDKKGYVNKKSCGYKPKNRKNKRANKIEWEHVMPASWMGYRLRCWEEGKSKHKSGRKYCRKNSELFNIMESDMHNLFPAIGELNQTRSNYKFGFIRGEERKFGNGVDFEVDSNRRTVEVGYDSRGRVARAMLYMHWKYNIPVSHDDLVMFRAWNVQYPPSQWERYRERVIYDIQGNRNPFIYDYISAESLKSY